MSCLGERGLQTIWTGVGVCVLTYAEMDLRKCWPRFKSTGWTFFETLHAWCLTLPQPQLQPLLLIIEVMARIEMHQWFLLLFFFFLSFFFAQTVKANDVFSHIQYAYIQKNTVWNAFTSSVLWLLLGYIKEHMSLCGIFWVFFIKSILLDIAPQF